MINNGIKEEIIKVYNEYMHCYFTLRDIDNLEKYFQKTTYGLFGTGLNEIGRDKKSWIDLYKKDLNSIVDPIKYTYNFMDIHLLSDSVGLVMSMFDIRAIVNDIPMEIPNLRMSIIFTLEDGDWKIVHKHISTPTSEHEDEESYPIKKLEELNLILEKKVLKKTQEVERKNKDLIKSMQTIKGLEALLPICSYCKDIRGEDGEWERIDWHISKRTKTRFTHSICPKCENKYFP